MDFYRVASGLDPLYSKREAVLRDGGSVVYVGEGCRLMRLHRMGSENGFDGFTVGACIILDESITGSTPLTHEQSRFERVLTNRFRCP